MNRTHNTRSETVYLNMIIPHGSEFGELIGSANTFPDQIKSDTTFSGCMNHRQLRCHRYIKSGKKWCTNRIVPKTLSPGDFLPAFDINYDFKGHLYSQGNCRNCATPALQKCYTGIITLLHPNCDLLYKQQPELLYQVAAHV